MPFILQTINEIESVLISPEGEADPEPGTLFADAELPLRLKVDVAADPTAPDALDLNRSSGLGDVNDAALRTSLEEVQALGAGDIRINQQQVNYEGERVGVNRPTLQYSLNGKRHYAVVDPASADGIAQIKRIEANDPNAVMITLGR